MQLYEPKSVAKHISLSLVFCHSCNVLAFCPSTHDFACLMGDSGGLLHKQCHPYF